MYITFSYFRSFGFPMPSLYSLSSLFLHLLADSWCKRYAVILIFRRLQLLVSFSFQVLFHSLSQGSFHLSLAVLVHYRSELRIQRFEDGTPMFDELLLHLLIFGLFIHSFFRFYGTNTLYGLCFIRFQIVLYKETFLSFFAFARHYLRNLFWFLFLKLLRCFSSLGSFFMRVSPFGYLHFSVPSMQFSLFASFRIRPRHPWEALSFLFKSMCSLFFWDIASLVSVFTVFSCIRCFIFRFGMLLKSFFAAQCTMNRIGFWYFFIIKEYFPTAASATITLLRLHFDQVEQLRSFDKHSFFRDSCKSVEFITCLFLGSSENPLS